MYVPEYFKKILHAILLDANKSQIYVDYWLWVEDIKTG